MINALWSGLGGVAGSVVIATLFAFWLKTYFGSYLSEKAKNLATHEDIQKLIDQVRETERVKSEISDRMWDRQTRWTYKRDLYVRIIECLTDLIGIASGITSKPANEDHFKTGQRN
jgi:hypothetical protein